MKKRSLIFIICYMAYTAIYIARLNLSVAAPVFADLGLADAAQIGILGSIFSIVYACGRLVNGSLGDSANFVLFIPLIGFVGRMIYPILLKAFREKEHVVSMVSFAVCILFVLPLCVNLKSPVVAVISLSMIYALVSVINTSILSIYPIRYADTGNVASVSGLMDFATYGGAGIGSLIFGVVIKHCGYTPMYISWAAISALSILILSKLAFVKKESVINEKNI